MTKETKKPLVSTITPCFHMERYLELFLEELPKQTIFDRLQVVLDHNEPTEHELELVREFQKRHPGVIKHIVVNPVEPIGTSMNRCIREADGDFVAIWNVDDLRTADSLERQAEILLDSDVDISHGNFTIVKSFGSTEGRLIEHDHYEENHEELTRGMVFGPFFMWRKELCKRAGMFDEQLRSGADFDLAIRLAIHGKVKTTKTNLGYYLDEGLGASTRGDGKQPTERTVIEMRYGILDKIEPRWLPLAMAYDIRNLYFNGEKFPVSNFVPKYESFLKKNRKNK